MGPLEIVYMKEDIFDSNFTIFVARLGYFWATSMWCVRIKLVDTRDIRQVALFLFLNS